MHYSGDMSKAELLFRTIISVSQLSVHGAISDWCGELAQLISDHSFSSTGKPAGKMNEQLDCRLSPEVLCALAKPLATQHSGTGKPVAKVIDERFGTLPEDIKVIPNLRNSWFMRKIFPGHCSVTIHDLDDGFDGGTGACRRI